MKTKYLLIAADTTVTLNSRFVITYVGDHRQDSTQLRILHQLATDRGWFLSRWDLDIANFVNRIADSLNCLVSSLPFEQHSLACLVRSLKRDKSLPTKPLNNLTQIKFRQLIDENYRYQRQLSVIRHAEASRRNKPKSLITDKCA